MIELPRRQFLTGLASLMVAPAIVKASSLMPVKLFKPAIDMSLLTDYLVTDTIDVDVLYGQMTLEKYSQLILKPMIENLNART